MIKIKIDIIKNDYLNLVKKWFEDKLKNGKFISSLGFTTDCRRFDGKFDKDNLESLIKLGNFPIQWKDADGNFQLLTNEQAHILLTEMIQYGLNLYQQKWDFEQQIINSNSLEELEAIKNQLK